MVISHKIKMDFRAFVIKQISLNLYVFLAALAKGFVLEECRRIAIKIGWAWCLTSVILALWEAEAGESLEARNLRPA